MLIDLTTLRFEVNYNAEADVLYISFQFPQQASHTVKANDNILLLYQSERLAGITILDASSHLPMACQDGQPQKGKIDFWDAYLAFRQRLELDEVDLDVDKIFANVCDRSIG